MRKKRHKFTKIIYLLTKKLQERLKLKNELNTQIIPFNSNCIMRGCQNYSVISNTFILQMCGCVKKI